MMKTMVLFLFCWQALAQAQTSYVLASLYPNASTCADPVAYYMLIQLGQCISSASSTSTIMKQASATTLAVYEYSDQDCTGTPSNSTQLNLNQCLQLPGQGVTDSVTFSITTSLSVPVTSNAFMTSMYSSCSDTDTPLERTIYNPEYCFPVDAWSLTYTCDSASYTISEYTNTQCSGSSTPYQFNFAPCTLTNFQMILGCYVPTN
eukprot:Phypoly_transcript_16803.p1 GENE.Phypoly_transcript_16803~~Phypoly_transcript_16803.p1  ORF type:complete len:205 (+),score=14.79 Phypoly_transcript_16803:185-799(+)